MFDLIFDSYQEIIIYTTYINVFIYLFLTITYSYLYAFRYHEPKLKTARHTYIVLTPIRNYSATQSIEQIIHWLPKSIRRLVRKNEDDDYSSSNVSRMEMYF